jgi:4-diphosphocytidyl-2-C-methyl-D-erythritol kinase
MLFFSNAKVNIGLYITSKRSDGFHNIETIFYPVNLNDTIEFIPNEDFQFKNDGYIVDCSINDNIIVKAYYALKTKFDIPPLHFHMYKNIPFGAGLGGGSSNASAVLNHLVSYFNLPITEEELYSLAENLGSDCPFFLKNKPSLAKSKGELLQEINLDLSEYYFAIVKPQVNISTKEAYSSITPIFPEMSLMDAIQKPLNEWKNYIKNDFEISLFPKYSEIKIVKEKLYELGAKFALMSGSGASVFGIFESRIEIEKEFPKNYFTWMEKEKG